jgi:hypothetical protein
MLYDMFSFSGKYCDQLNLGSQMEHVLIAPNLLPSSSALFQAASGVSPHPPAPSQPVAGPSTQKPSQVVEKHHAVSVRRGASVIWDWSQPPSAPSTTLQPDIWIGHFELHHWNSPNFIFLKELIPGSNEAITVFQHIADHENLPHGWKENTV